MAAKKIGAIIALDGEREFKENVTNCNKALNTLKSEMKLVEAQSEGQQNSLESLTKKHDVLSKILEEHKNKEKETAKALDHARESYDSVGKGIETLNRMQDTHQKKLQELQEEYKSATERMEAMKKAGNSSEQAMKSQEAVVSALEKELQKEEEALDDVAKAIEKGNRNYQTAGNRVKDWEAKLNTAETQVIKATREVSKNAKYMEEAASSTDKCAKSIDEYGKEVKEAEKVTISFGTMIKENLVDSMMDAAKEGAASMGKATMDIESAQRQLQASTGATAAEMRQYKTVMDDLNKNNYGEDINDVAKSMALVKQYTGELDPSKLKSMTENGIAMRDVFDMDLSETIRGVDVLIGEMGASSEEAFDLMAKGAQNGLDKSGELADNIAEYGSLYHQAGFSAKEMFAIMQNGLDSGAYSLDKVNDFVKEFTISLADGRIEDNLEKFSDSTQTLFKQWKAGEATSKDVFRSVINDLATATNKQEMLTLASDTWSDLGEDNAMDIITSLNKVNSTYDEVKGTMESIKDIKYDTLEARFQTLGKKFQSEVGTPIAEKALPAMEKGLDLVIDNVDLLKAGIGGMAAGVATFKTVSAAVSLFTTATEGATVAQTIFNTVCNANPIVLVTTAIAAGVTAITAYASTIGEASEESQKMAEMNQKVCDSAKKVADETDNLIGNYEENNAQMQAQGEYASILAGNIEKLAGKEKLSNEEKEVMQGYIAELNGLVPGLNLAYDEQAGKLNLTNEQMTEYINNCQKQIEVQAAQEYAIELIKKKSEIEIERIKIENEASGIEKERNDLLEEENDLLMKSMNPLTTWIAGKSDEKKTYDELTDAQKVNAEALEENQAKGEEIAAQMEATKERLKELGIDWDTATASTNGNTDATNANAEAQKVSADANTIAAQTIADTYTDMQQRVSEVLESQMNMFEEFNGGVQLSSEQLLANMQSQIEGVTNWADNMETLASRGVNQGILDKLAEMGPQGSSYVQAFASMTDEQLQQANNMWSQSLDMKQGVEQSVQGMIEQYTVSLNGGKEQVNTVMNQLGKDSVQGLVNGINETKGQAGEAGKNMASEVTEGAKNELDSHSPSRKFIAIGRDVVSGLRNGITDSKGQAVSAIKTVTSELIQMAKTKLNVADFTSIGKNISSGIERGIKAGKPSAENAIKSVTDSIKKKTQNEFRESNFTNTGRNIPQGLASGIRMGSGMVTSATSMLVSNVRIGASSLNSYTLYTSGYNVSIGLANGIRAGRSSVINAVANMCRSAVAQARRELRINSPSKVFEQLGSYTAEGFGVGYEKKIDDVNKMIRNSVEIPETRGNARSVYNEAGMQQGRFIVELPIYINGNYSKREIVEIAMDGISKKMDRYANAKGTRIQLA